MFLSFGVIPCFLKHTIEENIFNVLKENNIDYDVLIYNNL